MNRLRLITDILRPRRDYRIRTTSHGYWLRVAFNVLFNNRPYKTSMDRRWRWGRVLGWLVASLPWVALWSLWWLVHESR